MQNLKRNLERADRSDRSDQQERPSQEGNAFEQEGYISVAEGPKGTSLDEALEGVEGRMARLEAVEKLLNAQLPLMSEKELTAEFKERVEKRINLTLLADCDADPTRLGAYGYEQRYYQDIGVAKYSKATDWSVKRCCAFRGCDKPCFTGDGHGIF